MDSKKIVVAAVCLIVVLVAVAVLVRSQRADTTAPDDVLRMQYHIIDVNSLEVSEMTVEQWNRLTEDPDTGYRTYRDSTISLARACPECGDPIPSPPAMEEPPYNCPSCGDQIENTASYRP